MLYVQNIKCNGFSARDIFSDHICVVSPLLWLSYTKKRRYRKILFAQFLMAYVCDEVGENLQIQPLSLYFIGTFVYGHSVYDCVVLCI